MGKKNEEINAKFIDKHRRAEINEKKKQKRGKERTKETQE